MSDNQRIFYACQGVAISKEGVTDDFTDTNMIHGLQSIGITTNFNLEQAFELGQIEIYENIEGTPDIEVTLEKVLDGAPLIYHMASTGVDDTDNGEASGLAARSKEKCTLHLGIFPEEFNNIDQGNAQAEVEVECSGMFISSISYTIPVEGSMTESVTLVGNNKRWLTAQQSSTARRMKASSVTAFDGNDSPVFGVAYDNSNPNTPTASGGIQQREDVLISGCILPVSIQGVVGSGYANALNSDGTNRVHVQNVTISTDFSREDILELGRKTPYFRPANFPIEVTCEIEAITTSGDFVSAYEFGDPALASTASSGDNLSNEPIFIVTRNGYAWDLGGKNKLSSISYGGGDAGGGSATVTYSYSNFNSLDVQHRRNGFVGWNWLNDGADDIGQGTFPANLLSGGQYDT